MIHTYLPPDSRKRSSRWLRRRASTRSPWPVACSLGWPSSPMKSEPSGFRRSERSCTESSDVRGRAGLRRERRRSRRAWPRWSSARAAPGARRARSRCGSRRGACRGTCDRAITSASAFTMPPMRVAMPPAIVQKASWPFFIASSPRARRRSCSGVPSAGSLRDLAGPRRGRPRPSPCCACAAGWPASRSESVAASARKCSRSKPAPFSLLRRS